MRYFVLIRGPAAVGKTTIANELAKIINGQVIRIDKILEKNKLDYLSGDKCVKSTNLVKANLIAIAMLRKIKQDKVAIFDHNFYQKSQIKHLVDNLKNFKGKCFIFTLKADQKECISRDKKRIKGLGQKRVKDVYALNSKFNYGIMIDTNGKTVKETIDKILINLPNPETS